MKRPVPKQYLVLLFVASLIPAVAVCGESAAARVEVFEFDDFALYVPANVPKVRGIIIALGGPDTRAFVTDGPFGAPLPELEDALHVLARELRTLAIQFGLGILGTSRKGRDELPNQPQSDQLIFEAIREAATASGRTELSRVPIFLYGISGGTPQATGFTARNPERVAALLLKVPAPPERLNRTEGLAVPTYMILAERDTIADNHAVVEVFEFNRAAGGLWAVAVEPGMPHHSLTPAQRALTVNWLEAMAGLRFGASAQYPLQDIKESSGWLGHADTGISHWADYPGDRKAASWFPTRATAEEWWAFIGEKDAP